MPDLDERYVIVTPEAGARVAAAIKAQLAMEPGFNQAELVRRSGVSHPTVRSLMKGEPGRRGRTEVSKVSAAVGWTTDSIERVLDGGEPEPMGRPPEDRLDVIERRMDTVESGLAEIKTVVDEMRSLLEELR